MFLADQPNRNDSDMSMMRVKIGGYSIACHIVAALSMLLLPKSRKITSGDALIKASTIPLERPAGDMAGAKAIKTSTLSLRRGCIESVAKACAVPCEKPMYESEGWYVVLRT